MTAPIASTDQHSGNADAAHSDVTELLLTTSQSVSGRQEFYRAALAVLAEHTDSAFAALEVESNSGCFSHQIAESNKSIEQWKSLCSALLLDAHYKNLAIAKLFDAGTSGRMLAAMAVPLVESGSVVGSLALVVPTPNAEVARVQLAELKALVGSTTILASRFSKSAAANSSAANANAAKSVASGVARAAEYGSVKEFAFALANGLKTKFGFDQVSVGRVVRGNVRVLCISGFDDLYPRSPGARLIQQSMVECLDANRPVCFQSSETNPTERSSTGHRLHKQWHHETGNSPVASVPLEVDGECVAIISLRNGSGASFSESDFAKVTEIVSPLVHGLLLTERAEQTLAQHVRSTVDKKLSEFLRPKGWGKPASLCVFVAAMTWLALGKRDFVVTVPCEVIPSVSRQISAPLSGVLAAADVEPGDQVNLGDVMFRFETDELETEKERTLSEKRIAELELTHALTEKEHSAAAQAQARIKMATAHLQLINQKLERSVVRAPTSGIILSGEIDSRVGEVIQMGEPLLQLATNHRWSIEMHIPQQVVQYLEPGQEAKFLSSARPDLVGDCTLEKPPMFSRIVNGKNVFVTRCDLDSTTDWVRPGMTGILRVNAGRRSALWVTFHNTYERIRMWLWTF